MGTGVDEDSAGCVADSIGAGEAGVTPHAAANIEKDISSTRVIDIL